MKPFSKDLANQEYPIIASYLTTPSKRRSGQLMSPGVKFLVAHDTGNPGSTASGNVRYYERSRNEMSASAHIFVDDRQIIECIPALTADMPEKAWHVRYGRVEDNILYGYNANDAAIGVEYCYGGNINADEAYRKYIWVLAYACWRYGLDPTRSIVGHHLLDPGRKTDPVTGLAHSRRSYTQLLKDVVAIYQQGIGAPLPAPTLPVFPVSITTRGLVNIRKGEPFRRAVVARQAVKGTVLTGHDLVTGESVNGNDQWYDLQNNEYCWSGAVG
jgi:N-acetylmuramoyl-L-alanine amidase